MSQWIKSPIGFRLKEARTNAGLSQKNLGIEAGMESFTASPRMNQYETEKHVPDFGTMSRIAEVLDLPAAYFYCEDDDLALLISTWHKLSQKEKKQILSLL